MAATKFGVVNQQHKQQNNSKPNLLMAKIIVYPQYLVNLPCMSLLLFAQDVNLPAPATLVLFILIKTIRPPINLAYFF